MKRYNLRVSWFAESLVKWDGKESIIGLHTNTFLVTHLSKIIENGSCLSKVERFCVMEYIISSQCKDFTRTVSKSSIIKTAKYSWTRNTTFNRRRVFYYLILSHKYLSGLIWMDTCKFLCVQQSYILRQKCSICGLLQLQQTSSKSVVVVLWYCI